MPVCCIVKCGARKNKNLPQLSLHRFPKNEALKKKWLEAVGEENINRRHKEWHLCSLHFEDSCFNGTLDVMRLRDNSVPTVFSKILPIMPRCINCWIAIPITQQCRYNATHMDLEIISVLEEWIARQVINEDYLCQECFSLLILETNNRNEGNIGERQLGHDSVCVCCGISISRRTGRRPRKLNYGDAEWIYSASIISPLEIESTDICDDDDVADDDSDTLVESNVCRVCLALDVKMYDFLDIELREMFQNITGIAVTETDHSILERLCSDCAERLKAAAAFRNQALISDALLQGLASTGKQIRTNDITLIKENEDYLKSIGSLSAVEVFHIVDIDPENDNVPPILANNDTEKVQKTVRNDSVKLQKKSMIEEDNHQMDSEDHSMTEAPITTQKEYDQLDHILVCPNTGEESSNHFFETNPVVTNKVPFREDKINSANSSPLPSRSHVETDQIKKHVIKITKRDSISKIVSKNWNEVISLSKVDPKLKRKYVVLGRISKTTSKLKRVKKIQVKANTPTDEESMRLEDFEC